MTRPGGTPRADVQVTFQRRGDACANSVRTGRRGRFFSDDLPPGTYDVEYVWNTPRGQFPKERTLTLALFERRVGVVTVLR